MKTINVLLAGVGGQGIILAGDLLAEAALAAGRDVKKSEVHGMAQRGGSVVTHIRFGAKVHSPLIPEGGADFLAAFEEMEALRYLHLLRSGGTVILNRQRIHTLDMLQGKTAYPDGDLDGLSALPLTVVRVDGPELARRAGNPRTANVAVSGVLAAHLDLAADAWREALRRRLPAKVVAVNETAFSLGFETGLLGAHRPRSQARLDKKP